MRFRQPGAIDFRWTVTVAVVGLFLMALLVATLLYLMTYGTGQA